MQTQPVTLDAGDFEEAPASSSTSKPVSLSQGEFEFDDAAPAASAKTDDVDYSHPAGATGPLPGVPAHPAVNMRAPKMFGVDIPEGAQQQVEQGLANSYEQNPGPVVNVAKKAGEAAGNVVSGIKNVFTPTDAEIRERDFPSVPMTPQEKQAANAQASKGLAQVIAGGSTGMIAASAPELMELGLAADAGSVAAKAAIIKMLSAAEVGNVASAGAGAASDKLNLSPETKELVQTAAFFLPSLAGILGFKGGVGVDAAGNPGVAAQSPGGNVTAGVRGTPESYQAGVKVGGTQFQVNIPRGPRPASPTGLPEPGQVVQEQTAQAATTAITQANLLSQAAENVVNGKPPIPPPPPEVVPPGMDKGELTPKVIQQMGELIKSAPQDQQGRLLKEAHGKLSEWIAKNGGFVGPDGKLQKADSPASAQALARQIINDEVARQGKAIEQKQKEEFKAQQEQQKQVEQQKKDAEKAATKKNENGLTPDEQTAARVKTLLESNPGHKDPTGMIQRVLRVPAGKAQELIDQYKQSQIPTVGSKAEPVVEESRKTLDAQVDALAKGNTNVVMLPEGSKYRPKVPEGMKLITVGGDIPGAGQYIYNPTKIRAATIKEAAKAGTHGDLLGHLQTKEETANAPETKVVQAVNAEGTPIQDSVVTPDRVDEQAQVLQERHPEATIRVTSPEEVIQQRQAEPVALDEGEFEEATPNAIQEQSATEVGAHANGDEGTGRHVEGQGVGLSEQGKEAPREEGTHGAGLREPEVGGDEYYRELEAYQEKRAARLAEATKRFTKPYDVDLYDALHSFNRAGDRWEKMQQAGATNAEILEAAKKELGTGSSSGRGEGSLGYDTRGDKFWHGAYNTSKQKPTLQGPALAKEVRRLLDIPEPKGQGNSDIEGGRGESPELVAKGEAKATPATKYEFGNTHAVLPEGSEAHKAIESVRSKIKDSDLAGKGKDIGDNHVTVRYGIQGNDIEGIRAYLSKQAPFDAHLGKVDSFPPSKNSDGASVIKAQVEAPELHRMNAEIEKEGNFKPSDFPDYKPHVTIAYVKPEAVKKYTGMEGVEGKTFRVDEIEISDPDGNIVPVKLVGGQQQPSTNKVTPAPVKHNVTYLSGKDNPAVREAAQRRGDVGLLVTPLKPDYLKFAKDYPVIAIDNGVFSKTTPFDANKFKALVEKAGADPEVAKKVRFVVAPDVVGDAAGTLAKFDKWADFIHSKGLPVALAAQDGLEFMPDKIPWDKVDVLFIGGSTEWKLGKHTHETVHKGGKFEKNPSHVPGSMSAWFDLFRQAEAHDVPVHMGRVNSGERLDIAEYGLGSTTVDGTFLAFGPDKNLPQLEKWLDAQNDRTDLEKPSNDVAKEEAPSRQPPPPTQESLDTAARNSERYRESLTRSEPSKFTPPTPEQLTEMMAKDSAIKQQTKDAIARVERVIEEKNGKEVVDKLRSQKDGAGLSDHQYLERLKGMPIGPKGREAAKLVANTPVEAENTSHGQPTQLEQPEPVLLSESEAGGGREAADTRSANPEPVAEVPTGLRAEPQGEREAGKPSEANSPRLSGPDESVSGTGTGSGSGEGSDSALDNSPGQRVVKEANKNLAKVQKKNTKWFTHDDKWSAPPGVVGKMDANLRALQILRDIESNPRPATEDEKYELSLFVGWGSLAHVFDPYGAPYDQRERFRRANQELSKLLNPDEMRAASKSTINAHYTSPELVRSMWDIMKRFGFKGGNVLEPSMGSGNFFGMMPKTIRNNVSAMGNEMEPVTAGIAKILYPEANIFNKDFVDLIIPDNSIDLAISNVPFGPKIYDPKYPKLNAQVHDYFFVKSLDKVRPGGVVAFITSTGTMDKPNGVREALASKADLLGAIRFPSGAFAKNAGTSVTTDLILLQKRAPGQPAKHAGDWLKTVKVEVPNDVDHPSRGMQEANLNEYFDKNPDMMLGRPGVSQMYSRSGFALYPHAEGNLADLLEKATAKLPRGVMLEEKGVGSGQAETVSQFANQSQMEGQFVLDDKGNLKQVVSGKLQKPESVIQKDGSISLGKVVRVKAMVGLRDTLNDLLSRMTTEPGDAEGNARVAKYQEKLKKEYNAFVAKHGYLSAPANNVFEDDPHYPRLLALETYDKATKTGTPADILNKRTIYPRTPLTAVSDNPKDALYQILAERGYPDMEMMARLQGKDATEVADGLIKQGLIYRDPGSGNYEMKEKYLSGYVRDKLDYARKAVAQGYKEFEPNVAALEKVQPKDVPIADIEVKLGATWIPIPALTDFVRETMAQPWDPKITYTAGTWGMSKLQSTAEVIAVYGTPRVNADTLIELALNQKEITINDTVDDKPVINVPETMLARQQQQKIREQLNTWAQNSQKWAKALEKGYNYAFNNIVLPEYDGSHLTFPGKNASIELKPHQVNATWRLLSEGRGLLAHAVGAGKTYEGVAFVMEARRTGAFRKPVVNVPNHLVEQWRKEWLQLYPGANILVPTEKDFDSKNRQRLMAKIATSDFDAVIMARSQFDRFDISPELQAKVIDQQKEELRETLMAMRANRSEDKRTVKQMEKAYLALEAKLKKLQDAPRDKVINFDDTGIDLVLTDEAHDYKNLAFYTKMTRIAGLSQGDAKRAIAMKAKMDYLLERNGYKGVVFATGTPVQNTMAEQYNMTKYVAPDVLEKAGIRFFDDWAANFGSVRTVSEVAADGRSYKQRQKFSRFSNVPELMRMFRSFTDIKTASDLNLPVPKLEGGKPSTNMVPASEDLDAYVKDLMDRAATVKHKNPKEDNMLKITGDGRKAATDMRLVSADYPDDPGSKINQVVEDVYQEWKEGRSDKLTQMVFLDNYQAYAQKFNAAGELAGTEVRLDLYKDMRKKWIALGVPEKDIAIIGDYDTKDKKLKLFSAMNNGDIRILMGSTAKMGAGTNAQRLLKTLHHVDLPWRPGDLEQRNGRIIRQGNLNKSVSVKNWLTQGSFDTYMLQALESKATFIEQLMNGRFEGRTMEDVNSEMSMNLQEMKIATSGNPDVKKKFDLEAERNGLYQLKKAADRQRSDNTFRTGDMRKRASNLDAHAERLAEAIKGYNAVRGADKEGFSMTFDGKTYTDHTETGKMLDALEGLPSSNFHVEINGIGYAIETFDTSVNEPTLKIVASYGDTWKPSTKSMGGMFRSITNRQNNLESDRTEAIKEAKDYREKATKLEDVDSKFAQEERLQAVEKELKDVDQRLGLGGPKKDEVEQVATEEDADEPEEQPQEEDDDEEEGSGKKSNKPAPKVAAKGPGLRSSFFGVDVLAEFMADQGKKLYEKDIAPHVKDAPKAGRQITAVLYPRYGANVDALDSLFEAKGDREKHRVMLEQIEGGLDKFFEKMPLDANVAFMDRAKMGIDQLGKDAPETKRLREIRQLMEDIGQGSTQRMMQYKPNMKLREHYYGMLWKVIPDATGKHAAANAARAAKTNPGMGKRPFEGAKSFLKRSTLDNITEGINMGGEPVTKNAWKMFSLVEAQKMQYITAQDHWARLKNYGLRKFVRHGEKPPEGWAQLDDRLAKIFFPAESGEGMVHAGDWYLEESAARMLNNYLSRDLVRENIAGKAMMAAKNLATTIELSLSPFHLMFETLEAMASQLGLGGQRFWNLGVREGNAAEMAKGLKDAASFMAAPVLMARRGGNVLRSIQNPQEFANTKRGGQFLSAFPNAPEMIDKLYKGGLTWGQSPEYRMSPLSSFRESAKEGHYVMAVLKAFPALNDLIMKPLFEVYIPRLKWGLAMAQLSEQLSEDHEALVNGDKTEGEVARQVVDTVENRLGEMNFSNVGWNNTFKSIMQFLFRSVTWKLGNWRGATQAVGESAGAFADPLKAMYEDAKAGKRTHQTKDYIPKLGPNTAWLLGVSALTVMLGTVLGKYLSGKLPWDYIAEDEKEGYSAPGAMLLEMVHPRTGKKNPRTGKPERLSLPTGMKDFEHAFHDPKSYAKSSLSATAGRFIDMASNRDFFGDYVYDPNGSMYQKSAEVFKYVFPEPIGTQAFTNTYGAQDKGSKAMRALGFSASSGSGLDLTPAEDKMRNIYRDRHDPMTPKQKEERYGEGTIHKPSPQAVLKAKRRGDEAYAMGMFGGLTYSQAREVYELATPAEKKVLGPMLKTKRENLLKKRAMGGL